jgi:hypothetical protein
MRWCWVFIVLHNGELRRGCLTYDSRWKAEDAPTANDCGGTLSGQPYATRFAPMPLDSITENLLELNYVRDCPDDERDPSVVVIRGG